MTDKQLTTVPAAQPTQAKPKKAKRLKPKQRKTIEYWLDAHSNTFGNLYQSAIKAGFRPSYALNLTHLRPSWLSETMERTQLDDNHIRVGIEQLAMNSSNSRSPDDTRLKALELLAKINGLTDTKQGTTVNIVQPILGGASVGDIHTYTPTPNSGHSSKNKPIETDPQGTK